MLVSVLALAVLGVAPGTAGAGPQQGIDPIEPSGDPSSTTTSTLEPEPPPFPEPTPTTDSPTTYAPQTTTTETAPEPEEDEDEDEEPAADTTETTETTETTAGTTTVDLLVGPPATTTTTTVAAVAGRGASGLSDSTKLWLIVGALVGVAVLLTVFTVLYWRRTRPKARRRAWDTDGDGEPTAVQPIR
ncbi:hypothetical protein BH20ACT2_BH20ACT2_00220 [soil metagenome]